MKEVRECEKAIEKLAKIFVEKYFSENVWDLDCFWIGDDIGDTLSIGDYFFDLKSMLDYMKYSYTKKEMFEHYEYSLDETIKEKSPINIKNWLKLKQCEK